MGVSVLVYPFLGHTVVEKGFIQILNNEPSTYLQSGTCILTAYTIFAWYYFDVFYVF